MSTKSNKFDYIIVGAGTFGLSSCYYLSQNPSIKIALIEQFKIGHDNGSSHSQSRAIRSTYKSQFYRDLCLLGINQQWPEVQKALGETFIVDNPCVSYILSQQNHAKFKSVAQTSNGQLQMLSNEETQQLFPTGPRANQKRCNFMDTKSGIIFSEKYIQALEKYLKNKSNVTIMQNSTLKQINNNKNSVQLSISQNNQLFSLECYKLMLSCGKWITELMPVMKKILKVNRQTIGYWEMKNKENYQIGKFPTWYVEHENKVGYYGLPDVTGIGIKMAMHIVFDNFSIQHQSQEELALKLEKDLKQKVKEYFGEENILKMTKVQKCYYTSTKTEDFVVDWSDTNENILVCSPCSGHGFKFSPVIGKIASDLLTKNQSVKLFEDSRHIFRIPYHLGINLDSE